MSLNIICFMANEGKKKSSSEGGGEALSVGGGPK